ncbi:MAG TPA: EamA family transporter [Rubrobacteraceae bacterium]|nr:EamA family transporter [Rubrobacteraceae bacterium]
MFLVPLGFIGVGVFYLLYFYTVRECTVGTAAILLYSSPVFVVLLVWVFLKETLGALRLLALAWTFCGIFLVTRGYDPSTLEVTLFVLLTGLLSGLTYGLYSIFGKLLSRHLSPVTILSYALGIGAALPTLRTLAGLSFGSYALLFILALVHTALAFGLYTAGL